MATSVAAEDRLSGIRRETASTPLAVLLQEVNDAPKDTAAAKVLSLLDALEDKVVEEHRRLDNEQQEIGAKCGAKVDAARDRLVESAAEATALLELADAPVKADAAEEIAGQSRELSATTAECARLYARQTAAKEALQRDMVRLEEMRETAHDELGSMRKYLSDRLSHATSEKLSAEEKAELEKKLSTIDGTPLAAVRNSAEARTVEEERKMRVQAKNPDYDVDSDLDATLSRAEALYKRETTTEPRLQAAAHADVADMKDELRAMTDRIDTLAGHVADAHEWHRRAHEKVMQHINAKQASPDADMETDLEAALKMADQAVADAKNARSLADEAHASSNHPDVHRTPTLEATGATGPASMTGATGPASMTGASDAGSVVSATGGSVDLFVSVTSTLRIETNLGDAYPEDEAEKLLRTAIVESMDPTLGITEDYVTIVSYTRFGSATANAAMKARTVEDEAAASLLEVAEDAEGVEVVFTIVAPKASTSGLMADIARLTDEDVSFLPQSIEVITRNGVRVETMKRVGSPVSAVITRPENLPSAAQRHPHVDAHSVQEELEMAMKALTAAKRPSHEVSEAEKAKRAESKRVLERVSKWNADVAQGIDAGPKPSKSELFTAKMELQHARHRWAARIELAEERVSALRAKVAAERVEDASRDMVQGEVATQRAALAKRVAAEVAKLSTSISHINSQIRAAADLHHTDMVTSLEEKRARLEELLSHAESVLAELESTDGLATGITGITGATGAVARSRAEDAAREQVRAVSEEVAEIERKAAAAAEHAVKMRAKSEQGLVTPEEAAAAEMLADRWMTEADLLRRQAELRVTIGKQQSALAAAVAVSDLSGIMVARSGLQEAEATIAAVTKQLKRLREGVQEVADAADAEAEAEDLAKETADVKVMIKSVDVAPVEISVPSIADTVVDEEVVESYSRATEAVRATEEAARARIAAEAAANKKAAEAALLEKQAKELKRQMAELQKARELAASEAEEMRQRTAAIEEAKAAAQAELDAAKAAKEAAKAALKSAEAAKQAHEETAKTADARAVQLHAEVRRYANAADLASALAKQELGATAGTGATGLAFADPQARAIETVEADAVNEILGEETATGSFIEVGNGPAVGPDELETMLTEYNVNTYAELAAVLSKKAKTTSEQAMEAAATARVAADKAKRSAETIAEKKAEVEHHEAKYETHKSKVVQLEAEAKKAKDAEKQRQALLKETVEAEARVKKQSEEVEAAHKIAASEVVKARKVAAKKTSELKESRAAADAALAQLRELAAAAQIEVTVSTARVTVDQVVGATGGAATGGAFEDVESLEDELAGKVGGSASNVHHEEDYFVFQRALISRLRRAKAEAEAKLADAREELAAKSTHGFDEPMPLREAERHVRALEDTLRVATRKLEDAEYALRKAALHGKSMGATGTGSRYLDAETGMVVSPPSHPAGWNGDSNPPIFPDEEIDQAAACAYAEQKRQFAKTARDSAEEARAIGDMDTAKQYDALAEQATKDADGAGCGPSATGATGMGEGSVSGGEPAAAATGPTGLDEMKVMHDEVEKLASKATHAADRALHAEKMAAKAQREAVEARREAVETARRIAEQERKADAKRKQALELMRAAAEAASAGDEDAREAAMLKADRLEAEAEELEEAQAVERSAEKDEAVVVGATGVAGSASSSGATVTEETEDGKVHIPAGPLARLHSIWEAEEAAHALSSARAELKRASGAAKTQHEILERRREVLEEADVQLHQLQTQGRKNNAVEQRVKDARSAVEEAAKSFDIAQLAVDAATRAVEKAAEKERHANAAMREATHDVDPVRGDYERSSRDAVKAMRVAATKEAVVAHNKWDEVEAARDALHRAIAAGSPAGVKQSRALVDDLVHQCSKHASKWYRIMREARTDERRAQHEWSKHLITRAAREIIEKEAEEIVDRVRESISEAEKHAQRAQKHADAAEARDEATSKKEEQVVKRMQRLEHMQSELGRMEKAMKAAAAATGATGSASSAMGSVSSMDALESLEEEIEAEDEEAPVEEKQEKATSLAAAAPAPAVVERVVETKTIVKVVERLLPAEVVEAMEDPEVDLGPIGDRVTELAKAVASAEQLVQSSGASAEAVDMLHRAQTKLNAAKVLAVKTAEAKKEALVEKKRADNLEEQVSLKEEELKEAQTAREKTQKALQAVITAVVTTEQEVAEKEEELQNLESRRARIIAAMDDSATAFVELSDMPETDKEKLAATERQIALVEEDLLAAKTTLKKLRTRRTTLEGELEAQRETVDKLSTSVKALEKDAKGARARFLLTEDEANEIGEKPLNEAFSDEDRAEAASRLKEAHEKVIGEIEIVKQERAAAREADQAARQAEEALNAHRAKLTVAARDGEMDEEKRLRRALPFVEKASEKASDTARTAHEKLGKAKLSLAQAEDHLRLSEDSIALPRQSASESAEPKSATGSASASGSVSSSVGPSVPEGPNGMGTKDGYVNGVAWDSFLPGERPTASDSDKTRATKTARRALRLSEERLQAVRTSVARLSNDAGEADHAVAKAEKTLKAAVAKAKKAAMISAAAAEADKASGHEYNAKVSADIQRGVAEAAEADVEKARAAVRDLTLEAHAARAENRIGSLHQNMARLHAAMSRAKLDVAEASAAATEAQEYSNEVQSELVRAKADGAATEDLERDAQAATVEWNKAQDQLAEARSALAEAEAEWKTAEAEGTTNVQAVIDDFCAWRDEFLHGAAPAATAAATGPMEAPVEEVPEDELPVAATGVEVADGDLQAAIDAKKEADVAAAHARREFEARVAAKGDEDEVTVEVSKLRVQVAVAFAQMAEGKLVKAQALYDIRRSKSGSVSEASEAVEEDAFLELEADPRPWLSLTFGCEKRSSCAVRYQPGAGAEAPATPWRKDGSAYELDGVTLKRLTSLVARFVQMAGTVQLRKEAEAKRSTMEASYAYASSKVADTASMLEDKESERAERTSECTALRVSLQGKQDDIDSAVAAGDASSENAARADMRSMQKDVASCDGDLNGMSAEMEALEVTKKAQSVEAKTAEEKAAKAKAAAEEKRSMFVDRLVSLRVEVREAGEEVANRNKPAKTVVDPYLHFGIAAEGDGSPTTAKLPPTALPAMNAAVGLPAVASVDPPVVYVTGYRTKAGEAAARCAKRGLNVCKVSEMEKLIQASYSNCAAGWATQGKDVVAVVPMATKKEGCGNAVGVHVVGWSPKEAGVYCCRHEETEPVKASAAGTVKSGRFGSMKEEPAGDKPSGTGMSDAALDAQVQDLFDEVGLAGVTGPTGAAGEMGKRGLRGATGAAGVASLFSGTPVDSATGVADLVSQQMADLNEDFF